MHIGIRSPGALGCCLLFAAAVLAAQTAAAGTGTIEIWPGERQQGRVFYCYGGDWNSMLIELSPGTRNGRVRGFGKNEVEFPDAFSGQALLEVFLPAQVEFLGADIHDGGGVRRDYKITRTSIDGKPYQRIFVNLCNETLNRRLLGGRHACNFFIWFRAPEELDGSASYKLFYDGSELSGGSVRLVTAGVASPGTPMPERFGFHLRRIITAVPDEDFDCWAEFLSRRGVSSMGANARSVLHERMQRMFAANTRHGIMNYAQMPHFVTRHGGPGYGAAREATLARGGLVKVMDEICAGIESEGARAEWEELHGYYDMVRWNWEPHGPDRWPGYDDDATIAAFAEEKGIAEEMTPELLRSKYRDEYRRFRMEQIARPLFSLARTLNSVKPMHFRVAAGSGVHTPSDYDIFEPIADAISPMIYQRTPLRYARGLLDMLGSTSVPAEKFWPYITIGWQRVGVYRDSPGGILLDTVVTAAAGCGGIAHWPSVYATDGLLFGVYEGLARVAPFEDFYLDGEDASAGVRVNGIPYREETVDLGFRTMKISSPDWSAHLLTFAHRLGEEYAVTVLNYHLSEDAFARVEAPELAGMYLANLHEKTFQRLDGEGKALLMVAAESPGIWLATSRSEAISGMREITREDMERRLREARAEFLRGDRTGEVALGTEGDITVEYGVREFGGEERAVLVVRTPSQEVAFGPGGGRIYSWKAGGAPEFVCGGSFSTGGFGKDLLWLPEHARWSGDESSDYTLAGAANDGREARVVYEGEFRNAFPGIRVEKTYTVPAAGSTVRVDVKLVNDTVDQEAVELSYWSHNTVRGSRAYFVGDEVTHRTERGSNTVFIARGLRESLRSLVLFPRASIAGETGRAYAEYFPGADAGLIFRLPEELMNVYRWSSHGADVQTAEWMSVPLSIPAGGWRTLSYSITAVAEACEEGLKRALKDAAAGASPRMRN